MVLALSGIQTYKENPMAFKTNIPMKQIKIKVLNSSQIHIRINFINPALFSFKKQEYKL